MKVRNFWGVGGRMPEAPPLDPSLSCNSGYREKVHGHTAGSPKDLCDGISKLLFRDVGWTVSEPLFNKYHFISGLIPKITK